MKKHLWWILLVAGLVLLVPTVLSIVVPLVHTAMAPQESVAIIGGADGPTAIYLTQRLFWELLQGRVWIILAGIILVIVAVVMKITGKNTYYKTAEQSENGDGGIDTV